MKKYRLKLLNVGLAPITSFFILAGCASSDDQKAAELANERTRELQMKFENASQKIDIGKFQEAAEELDKLSVQNPASQLHYLIVFNAGVAYQANKNCKTALERFRQVERLAKDELPPLRARALYKSAESYTCLGDNNKATLSLIEAYRLNANLPADLGQAEIPAKLAAAYARVGNQKLAEEYYSIAEKGLAGVSRRDFPRVLLMMGSMRSLHYDKMTPDDYFSTLQGLQKYLVKAVQLNGMPWSKEAYDELMAAYDYTWKAIMKSSLALHSDDPQVERQKLIANRKSITAALEAIRQLELLRIRGAEETPLVNRLFTQMHETKRKFLGYLAENRVSSGLSEESKARDALKFPDKKVKSRKR